LVIIDVRIEHCTVCWGYRDRALILAEALRKRFGANVEVVGGTLGQFDVIVNGKLVTSRGESLLERMKPPRLPDVSDVIAAIESQQYSVKASRVGSPRHKFVYDRFGAWQDAQFYEQAALKRLVAHSDFEHASAIFELGCGSGRLAECLFKKHLTDDASYVGIDISTTMVGIATRRLANWGGRAKVQQVDGTGELPYEDGAFDRFVTTYVLDLLPELAFNHVLSEARRLLRPNGKLCVVSSTEGVKTASRILSSIWKRIYEFNPRLLGGCRPLRVSTLLELKAPDQQAFSALWPLWPTAISYAVSYLFITIIWINHHHLMRLLW
jgi:ubiquinone/menaquinone biosynthesis C-methylase UbiE